MKNSQSYKKPLTNMPPNTGGTIPVLPPTPMPRSQRAPAALIPMMPRTASDWVDAPEPAPIPWKRVPSVPYQQEPEPIEPSPLAEPLADFEAPPPAPPRNPFPPLIPQSPQVSPSDPTPFAPIPLDSRQPYSDLMAPGPIPQHDINDRLKNTFGNMLTRYEEQLKQMDAERKYRNNLAPWQRFVRDVYAPGVAALRPSAANVAQGLQRRMDQELSYGQGLNDPHQNLTDMMTLGKFMQSNDPDNVKAQQKWLELQLRGQNYSNMNDKWIRENGLRNDRYQNIDLPNSQSQIGHRSAQDMLDYQKFQFMQDQFKQNYDLKTQELGIKQKDAETRFMGAKTNEARLQAAKDWKQIQQEQAQNNFNLKAMQAMSQQVMGPDGEMQPRYPGLREAYPDLSARMPQQKPPSEEAPAQGGFDLGALIQGFLGGKKPDAPAPAPASQPVAKPVTKPAVKSLVPKSVQVPPPPPAPSLNKKELSKADVEKLLRQRGYL